MTTSPLNPRSINVEWTPQLFAPFVTGYRVTTRTLLSSAPPIYQSYTANVSGAEASSHTFTGLSPYNYTIDSTGVDYSSFVVALGPSDRVLETSPEHTVTIPRKILCDIFIFSHTYMYAHTYTCRYSIVVPAYNNGSSCQDRVARFVVSLTYNCVTPPLVCTACAGKCDFVHYRGDASCSMQCECNPAYTGDSCESKLYALDQCNVQEYN